MKNILHFLLFLFMALGASSQEVNVKPLKIGDKIPDVILNNLLGNRNQMPIKDLYKDKVLIINFWATWCMPCLKELPLLDSLVVKNREKLNVLSVTYQDKKSIDEFLKQRNDINTENLFVLPDDKILHKYFEHKILPHNIWIDSTGTVLNITGSEGITQLNIDLIIQGKSFQAKNKSDAIDFDWNKTFHLRDSSFISRSILTGYTEGIPGGLSYRRSQNPKKREIVRFFTFNVSLSHLLWSAIDMHRSPRNYYNLMRVETKDSTRFFWPSECPESFGRSKFKAKENWMKENLYSYELILPKPFQDTAFFDFMLNDLRRVFKVDIEKRQEKILCTDIYVKNKGLLHASTEDSSYVRVNQQELRAKNISPLELFHYLNEKVKPNLNSKPADPPFIDKTKLKFGIDIELKFKNGRPTYEEIKRRIEQQYGLSTRLEKHKYPILIVKDL